MWKKKKKYNEEKIKNNKLRALPYRGTEKKNLANEKRKKDPIT